MKVLLAALWILSLAAAAVVGAQQNTITNGYVLSGPDVGFRVDGRSPDGKPFGHFVVRVEGQWVEVNGSGRLIPVR